jgi:hypothetical protein
MWPSAGKARRQRAIALRMNHEVDVTSVTTHTAEGLMRDSGVSFNDAYSTAAFFPDVPQSLR